MPGTPAVAGEEAARLVAAARAQIGQEVARRLLSQPFFVAKEFTGAPGKYIPLKDTIKGFSMIVNAEPDPLPEQGVRSRMPGPRDHSSASARRRPRASSALKSSRLPSKAATALLRLTPTSTIAQTLRPRH